MNASERLRVIESAIGIDKDAQVRKLSEAIQALRQLAALNGIEEELDKLLTKTAPVTAPGGLQEFLERIPKSQHEIVHLMIAGTDLKTIAKKLELSIETLHAYIRKFYSAAGVHSREDLHNFLGVKAPMNLTFTPRERDIADKILSGASPKDIAKALKLSENTVYNYTHKLYRKAGVHNRDEFVKRVSN